MIGGLLGIQAHAEGRAPGDASDPGALAGEDPLATWHETRAATMATLTPEALRRTVPLPWEGEMTLGEFVARYPLELLVHTWDLARAAGQDVVLDPALVAEALPTAGSFAPIGREAGILGPERPVPNDADDQTRLLALFGRDAGRTGDA